MTTPALMTQVTTDGPNFRMYRDQSEELADSVARGLNAAGIPCVLWDLLLWATHGIPMLLDGLHFVVPDAKVAAAGEALRTGHFTETLLACPDTMECPERNSPTRRYRCPAFHMHIEQEDGYAVCLWPQSETLWFLPPLSASLARPRACAQLPRYLAFACERTALPFFERPPMRGAFKSDQTVVLVPKAHILTEALMRIMARDARTRFGLDVEQDFLYIPVHVERLGFLNLDLLPEPFKKIYEDFRDGPPNTKPLERLMRALGVPVCEEFYR